MLQESNANNSLFAIKLQLFTKLKVGSAGKHLSMCNCVLILGWPCLPKRLLLIASVKDKYNLHLDLRE